MARQLRIEIEGGLYHVIARGNGRQAIFHDNKDHQKFLSILVVLLYELRRRLVCSGQGGCR